MSEQELRDGLRSAVVDEPPLVFDVDRLVVVAEREVRRRRALVAVGVSTAAVAVAAVAIPVALGISGGGSSAELPAAAPPTASAQAVPVPTGKPARELQVRAAEMEAHLKQRVPQVVPNARAVHVRPFQGEGAGPLQDGQPNMGTFALFPLEPPRSTGIHIEVGVPAGSSDLKEGDKRPQPDGTTVYVDQEDLTRQGSGKVLSAVHLRSDGTFVRVVGYDYDPASTTRVVPTGTIPVTADQLVALATDPVLHY